MTKEIIKKCNSYDKQVGCYHTFDGKCNKENCQVYNLLQENEKLKEEIKQLTEWKRKSVTCQECYDEGVATADIKINRYKQALEEIREDMEQDTTCESRECGCDDYAECLNCIKETILIKIKEVLK